MRLPTEYSNYEKIALRFAVSMLIAVAGTVLMAALMGLNGKSRLLEACITSLVLVGPLLDVACHLGKVAARKG